MSYKAFKRLLGETSLERKCRWLLGAGVLVLMTGSFWVYAKQTEDLAYEQLLDTTGRVADAPLSSRESACPRKQVGIVTDLPEANGRALAGCIERVQLQENHPQRREFGRAPARSSDDPGRALTASTTNPQKETRTRGRLRKRMLTTTMGQFAPDIRRASNATKTPPQVGPKIAVANLKSRRPDDGRSHPTLDPTHRRRIPHQPRAAHLVRHRYIPAHHRRQLPHHSLRHREAAQAPEGGVGSHRYGRIEHSQRDPDGATSSRIYRTPSIGCFATSRTFRSGIAS